MQRITEMPKTVRAGKRDYAAVIPVADMFEGAFVIDIDDFTPAFDSVNAMRTASRVFAARHDATVKTQVMSDSTLAVSFDANAAPVVNVEDEARDEDNAEHEAQAAEANDTPAPSPRRRNRAKANA